MHHVSWRVEGDETMNEVVVLKLFSNAKWMAVRDIPDNVRWRQLFLTGWQFSAVSLHLAKELLGSFRKNRWPMGTAPSHVFSNSDAGGDSLLANYLLI